MEYALLSPKILFIDIETSPIEAYTWGIWDVNVSLEQIKTDYSILSFCAKWANSTKVIYSDTSGRGKSKVRDDKKLLGQLWTLLDTADIVVAQNGQQFDLKKINARLISAGFGPPSPVRVVDTLLIAKKHFGFTSNKLAWLSEQLTSTKKQKHREFPGFELWIECLNDNPKAWKVMKEYNIADVIALEELYVKFRPWISGHPNLNAYVDDEDPCCPKCAEDDLKKEGFQYTQTGKFQQYSCGDCGGWSRGKQNLLSIVKRKASLSG